MKDCGSACQLRSPNHSRLSRCTCERSAVWSLSLGRRCSTQAFRAHAPCRAWSDLSVRYKRPLCYRQASLLRCKTVVRRASCGLQTTAGCRVGSASDHCVRCLSEGGAARELVEHARHAALIVMVLCPMNSHRTGERPLSFGARPWCDIPAASSQRTAGSQVTCPGAQLCSLSLGKCAALELVARALRAALVAVSIRLTKIHYADKRHLPFDERPWCDAPAATSQQTQPAVAWHARACDCARCLWGRGAALEFAARARRAALAMVGTRPTRAHCTGERFLPFYARSWCDVPATSSNTQSAVVWHTRARRCARCLWG